MNEDQIFNDFNVILKLDDRSIQRTLREIDLYVLAKALKTTNGDVREKIFRNMSNRALAMLKEKMEYMGHIRLEDAEDAQKEILSIIRYLWIWDIGEISIADYDKENYHWVFRERDYDEKMTENI